MNRIKDIFSHWRYYLSLAISALPTLFIVSLFTYASTQIAADRQYNIFQSAVATWLYVLIIMLPFVNGYHIGSSRDRLCKNTGDIMTQCKCDECMTRYPF